MTLANDTDLGLTAGFFSADHAEIDRFLNEIQAGVVYVNRRRGRHHRRVARRAAVRRVEGLGHQRQGGRRPLLRAAVPARAVTDGGGVMPDSPELTWLDPSRPVPDVRTALPGPRARAVYRTGPAGHQPVAAARLPADARAGAAAR